MTNDVRVRDDGRDILVVLFLENLVGADRCLQVQRTPALRTHQMAHLVPEASNLVDDPKAGGVYDEEAQTWALIYESFKDG